MSVWYDSTSDTTGETFQSPGEVELRAGADAIITATRASLTLGCDADKKLALISLRAELDRSQLLRLWKADPRLPLSRDDFVKLPVNAPITVVFVGKPALVDRLSGLVASGLEAVAKEKGTGEVPLCLDVNNYDVESMSV